MSKITTDLSSLGTSETTQSMQQANNEFSNFMSAPVRKLDADEYMANDLDGVTESLTGSGNLNFLMMQAGQTDEAMGTVNPFDLQGGGDFFAPGSLLNNAAYTPAPSAYNDIAMDRAFEMPNGLGRSDDIGGGYGNSNGTLGGLGASQAASNSTSAKPFSDTSNYASSLSNTGTNGNDGGNGNNGNGNNGTNGNGTNGTDGRDGTPGGNTYITENTFIDFGDTYRFVRNITNEYNDFLTELTENTFSTVNNIINNFFEEFPFDLGPVGIDLHAVLDDVLDIDLGIISGDQVISVLNEMVDLSPVMNPVQDLVGDILTDLHVTAILDPFQYDASPNDYDVHVGTGLDILGLQIPDIGLDVPLDPLEGLLGDLDVSVDLAQMLNVDNLLDLDFLSVGPNDTDLALGGFEIILDTNVMSNLVETIVNPVEDVVGDIDTIASVFEQTRESLAANAKR